jgi:photosystem II stability/assembly factor-like uncharacterized protein
MKKYIIAISLCYICIYSFAQSKSLQSRIVNEKNFYKVVQMAKMYYDSIDQGLRTKHPADMKRKHWERYRYHTMTLLNPDSTIGNFTQALIDANLEVEKENKSQDRSTNSLWEFVGPSNHVASPTTFQYIGKGRVDRICFHPTNANIILVGTPDAGIWKTIDGGNSWYNVNQNLPAMGISGVEFSKSNPNIVYAITGSGDGGGATYQSAGVLKSLDGGETWTLTNPLSNIFYTAFNIAVHDSNENICYAATSIGLYRTIDGGVSWNAISSTFTYDVKLKPLSPNTIYSVSNFVFTKWLDNGTNVSFVSSFSMSDGRKGIGVSQADPARVYILSGPVTAIGAFNGFWESTNSGSSFILKSNTPNVFGGEGGADFFDQSGYDFAITVNPANANEVYAAGAVVNKSINNGVNWTSITTYGTGSGSPNYVHPDIHDVKLNPLNGYLYCANDGGFYRSTDLGSSWSNITNNITTTQIYHMAVHPTNHLCNVIGTQDNGTKVKTTSTTLMDHIAGGDGFAPSYNPVNPSMFYSTTNSSIDRYTNNGATKANITPKYEWFMKTATHVSDGNIVFAGGTRLYKSTNQGSSWDTIFQPANQSIATCPSLGTRLYISGSDGVSKLHRVDNIGATLNRLDTNPGLTNFVGATDIAVHPELADFVYVTYHGFDRGNKVFFSSTAGASWTNVSFNLPNIPILSIQVSNNNDVYVGTDIGVFYKANLTNVWRPYGNQLPKVRVSDLVYNQSANLLYAGTFGRGIWRTNGANGICTSDITALPTNMEGFQFYEASNSISTASTIKGSYGTDVNLKAGNFIDLKDGFEIKDEGTLGKFYIDNCGENIPTYDGKWATIYKETQGEILTNGDENDAFGRGLAIDGDYAVIGAPYKDISSIPNMGTAYIYKNISGTWTQISSLLNSTRLASDEFGSAVSISGNKVAVSAPYKDYGGFTNVGDVEISNNSGSTWTFEQKIQDPSPANNNSFGESISLKGDFLIIGAPGKTVGTNTRQGKVFVYKRSGTNWLYFSEIAASDGETNDEFGTYVDIDGNRVVVGAPFAGNGGKVYVFEILSSSLIENASFSSNDPNISDQFSKARIDGDYIAVGVPNKNGARGALYIFKYIGGTWVQQVKIENSVSSAFDYFGGSFDISGKNLMIGDPNGTNPNGQVFLYRRT